MHSTRNTAQAVIAVVALVGLTGCLSPWIKRAENAPDPKPSPVLVAGFNVRFDNSGQEKSLLDAAVDAAQNAQLAEFGTKATDMLAGVLAEHGYSATYDGPRSSRLDAIQLKSDSTTAALTGLWRHPDASHMGPDHVDSLFVKPSDVLAKIKSADGAKEYFAFVEVVIRDKGLFMKEPYVVVRTSIYDQDAKKLLDLQGIGEGESGFMFADRSPKNLELALQRGFESLKTAQPQAL